MTAGVVQLSSHLVGVEWVGIRHLDTVLPCLQICPSCSNTNFSWRGECNKCGKARPEDAPTVGPPSHLSSMPGVQLDSHARPGDW